MKFNKDQVRSKDVGGKPQPYMYENAFGSLLNHAIFRIMSIITSRSEQSINF